MGRNPKTNWSLRFAVDELNLAEFPLAAISDRPSKKEFVVEDQVLHPITKKYLPRKLVLSGSAHYGLPTALDDDILLACIQISRMKGYSSPTVQFSRYEILKLLGWRDQTRNYRRVAESLRRWKGLTVYSERSFFDHGARSWVNRDFGIFDSLYIYHKDASHDGPALSHFTWNEVVFKSFESGYLRSLEWDFYCSLKDPVAKRLYRFLGKRFYLSSALEFDLREFAEHKVRLSPRYNIGQIKRALRKGIAELEEKSFVRKTPNRFLKKGKGVWTVSFEAGSPAKSEKNHESKADSPSSGIEGELLKRGVTTVTAVELATTYEESCIRTMVELFDWYNSKGQTREAGFLIHSIKNPQKISMPRGFESSEQGKRRRRAEKNRIESRRDKLSKLEDKQQEDEKSRREAFSAFWKQLSSQQQSTFEEESLRSGQRFTLNQYRQALRNGSAISEHYKTILLHEQFDRMTEPDRSRWISET